MGTTTHGLPYPDAADPFSLGNEQIQDLAEALDTDLNQYAKLARISTQTFANSTAALVQWTSADSTLTADFDLTTTSATDDTLTYLGRSRFVAWRYGFKLPDGLSAGTASGLFRRKSTATLGSDDYIYKLVNFADIGSGLPIGDSGLVWMATGSEWQLVITQDTSASRAVSAYASFKAV